MREIKQSGFTLVELVIVLAVSGLVLFGVIIGQEGVRQAASFTTSVDQVRNQIAGIRNEATQAVNYSSSRSTTGQSPYVVFGKMVEFDSANPTQMKISTLVGNDGALNNPTDGLTECDTRTVTLVQSASYAPASPGKQAVIFVRDNDRTRLYMAKNGYVAAQLAGAPSPATACANATAYGTNASVVASIISAVSSRLNDLLSATVMAKPSAKPCIPKKKNPCPKPNPGPGPGPAPGPGPGPVPAVGETLNCDNNVLNPASYSTNSSCFFNGTDSIPIVFSSTSKHATIVINPGENSITRSFQSQ